MAKKPLESTKVVDNTTTQNQILKPKDIGNKKSNFSKLFKKYQTIIISFALVLVLLVGGSLAYFKINNDQRNNASAGLNCDTANGFSYNSTTSKCEKTEYQDKICPLGIVMDTSGNCVTGNKTCASGTLDSGNCITYTYSCVFPNGWIKTSLQNIIVSGSNCVSNVGGSFFQKVDTNQQCIFGGSISGGFCLHKTPNGILQSPSTPCPNGSPVRAFEWTGGMYGCGYTQTYQSPNNVFYIPYYYYLQITSYPATQNLTIIGSATCPSSWNSVAANSNNCYQSATCSTTDWTSYSATQCKKITAASPTSYTIDNTSIVTATCNPANINKSTTDTVYTNCTFPLSGAPVGVAYVLPAVNTASGNTISLAAGILNTNGVGNGGSLLGNSDPCTISGSTLVCNKVPIPTNTNIGTREIIIHQPNVDYYYGKGTLGVNEALPTPIKSTDLNPAICTPVASASAGTVTCTATFLANKSGSVAFTSSPDINGDSPSSATGCNATIANASATSASCTFTAITVTTNTVGVMTATASGDNIGISAGNVTVAPLSSTTVTAGNLSAGTCTTVILNQPTTCDYPLTGNASHNYALSGSIKAKISDLPDSAYSTTDCTITGNNAPGAKLTCSNIPTLGSTIGTKNVRTSLAATPTASLIINPIVVTNDNLTDALENCTNKTTESGIAYDCTFALKAGYKFPATSNFRATTSTGNNTTAVATTPASCTAVTDTSTTLTCNNIPSDTNSTTSDVARNILLRLGIATETYTDKGGVTITAGTTDTLLIPKTATTITESPNPEAAGLSIYGKSDYSLTVKDARLNKVGTVDTFCYFKIKEATAIDGNSDKGYEKLTSTVNGGLGVLTSTTSGAAYDTTTKSYKVTYDNTNGANIKLASGKQLYTDYNLQIRCTRSDSQTFARDQKINFLFGAYSVVDISGQVG
jgi:hypothetical protein